MAFRHYGVTEIPGPESNPQIDEYLLSVGMEPNDEIPWCSAALNLIMRESGCGGTGLPNARSWLVWGTDIPEPRLGCVVVLWRISPDSPYGHVGLFIGLDGSRQFVYILGGNQNNQFNVMPFPIERVLSYRWVRRTPR